MITKLRQLYNQSELQRNVLANEVEKYHRKCGEDKYKNISRTDKAGKGIEHTTRNSTVTRVNDLSERMNELKLFKEI